MKKLKEYFKNLDHSTRILYILLIIMIVFIIAIGTLLVVIPRPQVVDTGLTQENLTAMEGAEWNKKYWKEMGFLGGSYGPTFKVYRGYVNGKINDIIILVDNDTKEITNIGVFDTVFEIYNRI